MGQDKGGAGTDDIVMGVCYRPPDQEDPADEAVYRQIGAASHSQGLVLMGVISHPSSCSWDSTAGHKQSKSFLECIDDNFLLPVIEEPMRRVLCWTLFLPTRRG